MSAEQNKATVRRWLESGWNSHDPSLADELLTSDYMLHEPGTPNFAGGIPAFKEFVNNLLTALPDVKFTIEDMRAEGDKVVWRWTGRATHGGSLMGIPPTGKPVQVTGIIISRFTADGKWAEDWVNWDTLGLLQQIGVIPSIA